MVAGVKLTIPKDDLCDKSAFLARLVGNDNIASLNGSVLLPIMQGITTATPKERQQCLGWVI